MILALAPILASLLPSVLLPALQSYLTSKRDIQTSEEMTKREVALRTIDERIELRKVQAEVIQAGMHHKPFWIVWSLFAVPLGLWWAAVVLDSIFLFSGNIPDLPASIKPWANQIFGSIFLSGGGVASAQMLSKAISTTVPRKETTDVRSSR